MLRLPKQTLAAESERLGPDVVDFVTRVKPMIDKRSCDPGMFLAYLLKQTAQSSTAGMDG